MILFNLREVQKSYQVNFKKTGIILIRTGVVVLVMWIVCSLLNAIGFTGSEDSKLIAFLLMCCNGLITLVAGLAAACLLRLPQAVFHIRLRLPGRGGRHV